MISANTDGIEKIETNSVRAAPPVIGLFLPLQLCLNIAVDTPQSDPTWTIA